MEEDERREQRDLASVAGEEARDLSRLLAARVPVARGRVVPLESRAEALADVLREALATGGAISSAGSTADGAITSARSTADGAVASAGSAADGAITSARSTADGAIASTGSTADGARRVSIKVLAPSAAERRSLELAGPGVLRAGADVDAFARAWTTLRGRDVALRVVPSADEPCGGAASVDPQRGDPDILTVWSEGQPDAAWRIDRRSTRVEVPGEGLGVILAERVADVVDRVQLVLGAPVQIDWVLQDDRPRVLGVRPLTTEPTFLDARWRRVALVAADEGTVAPLAVDTLDRALRAEGRDELAVRRIYARPYRRREPVLARLGEGTRGDLSRATTEAARATASVAPFLAEAFRFERAATDRLAAFDAESLAELSDEALLTSLRERQRYVAEGLRMLDVGRSATRTVLAALEVAVGPMRREQHAALAALRMTRARRRFHDKLAALAKDVEDAHGVDSIKEASPPSAWSPTLKRRFDELRESLGDLRPLGVDVAPVPYARDEDTLHRAMLTRPRPGPAARERAREEAIERLADDVSRGLGGALRVTVVRALGVLALRVARAKGGAAESVSGGLLRLRRAASEVGSRLVRAAMLDEADDALYLSVTELEDAMRGEPGAYAARVRLRREDDQRWRSFVAPRRIGRG